MATAARFGKYEVVALIGEGGFGRVHQGFDPDLKRTVAIKTLAADDPDLRARFAREAEIVARLSHPNITMIFDYGVQDGVPYLVQEFLSGEDLGDKIRHRRALPVTTRLSILRAVAEGLGYAHRQGVVHRDVKPANLRVLEDGTVKIMDFGIARLQTADRGLTRTGTAMGTSGYLPPEQLRGEPVDHRADLFAFGATTYELFAARRPFEGDDLSTVFYRICHEEPPPLDEVATDCPPRLARLVERCLKKRAEDRPADFAQVIVELDAIKAEADRRAAAPPPSTAVTLAPTVMANPPSGFPTGRPGDLFSSVPHSVGGASPAPPSGGDSYRTALGGARSKLWLIVAALAVALGAAGAWRWLGTTESPPGPTSASGSTALASPPLPPASPDPQQEEPAKPEATGVKDPGTATQVPKPGPRPTDVGSTVAVVPAQPSETPAPAPTARFLVIVTGDAGAAGAGAALLGDLLGAGVGVIEGSAADAGEAAAAARRRGARFAVVGRLTSETQAALGQFHTGRAELRLTVHRAADGSVVLSETFQVGRGGVPGALEPSAETARAKAVETVGRRAAERLLRWEEGP